MRRQYNPKTRGKPLERCGPTGKVMFKTYHKASVRLHEITDTPMRVYKCEYCANYHLTSKDARYGKERL